MWFLALYTLMSEPAPAERAPTPEERALTYLAGEVQRWPGENKCFSCHNNGDAARALHAALRAGRKLPPNTLDETTRWLADPARWDRNGGDEAFNNKYLGRRVFAATLTSAAEVGLVKEREPLLRAAAMVAEQQERDGGWKPDADGLLGSPITHGPALTTVLARRTLLRADERKYAEAVKRADIWLRNRPVPSVLEAAGVLLGLERADDEAAKTQRRKCFDVVRRGESKDGGWGPYVTSPSEVFDTAIVVLALASQDQTEETRSWIRRGRAYLIANQRKDGSWQETTRPSGAESYPQRISTAAWATLALLASVETEKKPP